MKWLYLALDLGSISVPFIFSYHPKLLFYKNFKHLTGAIIGMLIPFILWDVYFTDLGVWGFNETYLLGIDILNLPIEEWLFFICIPFACVYTYHCIKLFYPKPIPFQSRYISIPLIIILAALIPFGGIYTLWAFLTCIAVIAVNEFIIKASYLNNFYFAFIFILIPFFLVNGVLTGSFIEDQVVWYNNEENLGIRMGTIPFEDTFYGLALLLGNVTIYEWLKSK